MAPTNAIEYPSWDRFISDPVEESGTDLHLRPAVRRKEELDTIQMNNVTILEAGVTRKPPSGIVPGTKCLDLKQRPLFDPENPSHSWSSWLGVVKSQFYANLLYNISE